MQTQPDDEDDQESYAQPLDGAHHRDPYELNLDGLVAFNPILPALRRALGPGVEVEQPVMWPGPEVELHRAGHRTWDDPQEWVRVKLDMRGHTHVINRGQEISDRRAGELLGIPEPAFARGHRLAAAGLRAGEAAMDPANHSETDEVVEARTPEQRLAAAQRRDVPTAAPAPNPGLSR